MADQNKIVRPEDPADDSTKAATNSGIVKSQANYTGKEHSDLVEVEIVKDGDFYKKGDKDQVHPSLAEILKEKGLIKETGRKVSRPSLTQNDQTVDA